MTNLNRERRRILLVEDHEDAWEIVALTFAECKLTLARNFDDGLRLARQGYFDLYILDNWLPDGSGIGLCRAIREFDPHTPILFCSVAACERDIEDALRGGAQDYLVKPIIPDEIMQAVSRLISTAGETVFEARRAEVAAIREELAIRHMENAGLLEKAKENRLRAEEKEMRVKAQIAFLAAGASRGDFAREWSSVFLEEVRGARMPTVAGG